MTEETEQQFDLVKSIEDTQLSKTSLQLPSYDDLTDERVVKEMQTLFKGFSFDPNENVTNTFKTVDQLYTFVRDGIQELRTTDTSFKRSAILNDGAIMAKRWYFGYVVDKCMAKAAKGSNAADKLTKAAGISQAYLYQFRNVGANLDMKDAYILGMYGVDWGTIRELGAIADKAKIQLMIKCFVDSITDPSNSFETAKAKLCLKQAIKDHKTGKVAIDVTDIKQIEARNNLDQVAPEYCEAMKWLKKLDASFKNIGKEQWVDQMLGVLADCFVMDDVPDADTLCDELHEKANAIKKKMQTAYDMMQDIMNAMDSLQGVKPLTQEEADNMQPIEAEVIDKQ